MQNCLSFILQTSISLILSLYVPILFPIKFDIVMSRWSIVHTEGSQVMIPPPPPQKKNVFLSLKIEFVFANNADPDEMPHIAAFHLGKCCTLRHVIWVFTAVKLPVLGLLVFKGLSPFFQSFSSSMS